MSGERGQPERGSGLGMQKFTIIAWKNGILSSAAKLSARIHCASKRCANIASPQARYATVSCQIQHNSLTHRGKFSCSSSRFTSTHSNQMMSQCLAIVSGSIELGFVARQLWPIGTNVHHTHGKKHWMVCDWHCLTTPSVTMRCLSLVNYRLIM